MASTQARVVDGVCSLHGPVKSFELKSIYLNTEESAFYVRCLHPCGCPSADAFREWARRRGLHQLHRGRTVLVMKTDLDRAIGRPVPFQTKRAG